MAFRVQQQTPKYDFVPALLWGLRYLTTQNWRNCGGGGRGLNPSCNTPFHPCQKWHWQPMGSTNNNPGSRCKTLPHSHSHPAEPPSITDPSLNCVYIFFDSEQSQYHWPCSFRELSFVNVARTRWTCGPGLPFLVSVLHCLPPGRIRCDALISFSTRILHPFVGRSHSDYIRLN